MTAHTIRIATIRRRDFGIESVVHKPVCGCGWKGTERHDPDKARSDGVLHWRDGGAA